MTKLAKVSIALILCMVLFAGTGAAAQLSAAISDFSLYVNGQRINQSVVVINGTSYLPVRAIGTALGAEVGFNSSTRRIDVNMQATTEPTDEPSTPTTTGNSRKNPARLGETVTVQRDDWVYGKSTLEMTLIELISGNAAWAKIQSANPFNSAPDAGMEYVLAKFKVKVLSTEDDSPVDINHALFEGVSATGVVYSQFFSLSIEPNLSTDIYQGGEHTGYTYFMVTKGDSPLAVFDKGYTSETWFSIHP